MLNNYNYNLYNIKIQQLTNIWQSNIMSEMKIRKIYLNYENKELH